MRCRYKRYEDCDEEQSDKIWWPHLPPNSWSSHGHVTRPYNRKSLCCYLWSHSHPSFAQLIPLFLEEIYWWRPRNLASWPRPNIDAANWTLFKSLINAMGFKWTTTEFSEKVVFMDMTIEISKNRLVTSLYSKPMTLYQYIPPTSYHPPSIGPALWIFQLCSRAQDVDSELALFYNHLLDHGFKASNIIPLFIKGIDNANHYLSLTEAQQEEAKKAWTGRADKRVFFHLPFHLQNPSSGVIQCHWQNLLLSPPGKESLNSLYNWSGYPVSVKRLTVAYHLNPNLANILSYRNLTKCTGLKASLFLPGTTWDKYALFFQSFAKRDGKCLKKWGIQKYYLNLLSQWPLLYLWEFLWEIYLGSDSGTFRGVRTSLDIILTTPNGHKTIRWPQISNDNTWDSATLLCWDLPYFVLPLFYQMRTIETYSLRHGNIEN